MKKFVFKYSGFLGERAAKIQAQRKNLDTSRICYSKAYFKFLCDELARKIHGRFHTGLHEPLDPALFDVYYIHSSGKHIAGAMLPKLFGLKHKSMVIKVIKPLGDEACELHKPRADAKYILVFDDVYDTGITVGRAAFALRKYLKPESTRAMLFACLLKRDVHEGSQADRWGMSQQWCINGVNLWGIRGQMFYGQRVNTAKYLQFHWED